MGDRERDVPEPHRGGAEHLHVLVVEHHAGLTDLHELQADQLAGDDRVAVAKHDDDVRLPQGVRRGLILVGDQREGVEHRLVVLVDHRTHQLPRGDLLHRGGEAGVVRLPLGHPDAVAEIQKALVAHVLAQADDRGAARVDFSGNRVQVQRPDAVQVFDQIGGCGLFTSGKRGKDQLQLCFQDAETIHLLRHSQPIPLSRETKRGARFCLRNVNRQAILPIIILLFDTRSTKNSFFHHGNGPRRLSGRSFPS